MLNMKSRQKPEANRSRAGARPLLAHIACTQQSIVFVYFRANIMTVSVGDQSSDQVAKVALCDVVLENKFS